MKKFIVPVILVFSVSLAVYLFTEKRQKSVASQPQAAASPKPQGPVENLVGFYMASFVKAKACAGLQVGVKKGDVKTAQKILKNKQLVALGEGICAGFDCETACVPVRVVEVQQ